jgi:hypothetical protein
MHASKQAIWVPEVLIIILLHYKTNPLDSNIYTHMHKHSKIFSANLCQIPAMDDER